MSAIVVHKASFVGKNVDKIYKGQYKILGIQVFMWDEVCTERTIALLTQQWETEFENQSYHWLAMYS